jgi:hypothetical protein
VAVLWECVASAQTSQVFLSALRTGGQAETQEADRVRRLLFTRPNVREQFSFGSQRLQTNRFAWASRPGITVASAAGRHFRLMATNDNWLGGAGNWSTGTMWSAGVPTSSSNVFIDNGLPAASTVTLDIGGAAANNVTISSGDSLSFSNNTNLTVSGTTISNAGSISLNSAGNFTELIIGSSNVTLSGAGTLTLGNNANNYIFGSAAADKLTNQSTIQGAGMIGNSQMALSNSGTINANQTANSLNIQTSNGVTNTGTLEATGGANLNLNGDTYTNTGGTILASGTGSTVSLNDSVTITGGTLKGSGGGVVQTPNGQTSNLGGVTITGTYAVQNNGRTNITGTITNNGSLQLNSVGNLTELVVNAASATLAGTGTLAMGNNTNNLIFGAASADVLTNKSTIQGSGNIGDNQMGLVNSGTINANQSNALTIQTTSGTTNTGTLEGTNGATLNLTGDTYTNTSGTIQATGTNSAVNLNSSTISGGTLTTSSGGIIQTPNGFSSGLTGVTNSGTYAVQNNGTTTLTGTITNSGAIQLNSAGNFTELRLNGNVSLTGSGTVTMGNNTNNFILGNAATDILTNINNTVQGAGNIGDSTMALVNQSVIDANQSNPLTIQTSNGTKNTGTLEATSGATLILDGDTYTNTGGTIKAVGSGSTVTLENVTINGGKLSAGTGALIQTPNGQIATLSGLTISGTLAVQNNAQDILSGTITNNGTIQLNSAGNFTELRILSPSATLTGTGTVTLSDNVNNFIVGNAGGEQFTNHQTIVGPGGNIGDGNLTITNQGTINATHSGGGNSITIQPGAGGFTNTGTLEATGGGSMILTGSNGGAFTNTGGTIQATGSGSVITLENNPSITGGTLTASGGGLIQTPGGHVAALNSLTTSGTLAIQNNADNLISGTITNNGTIQLNSAGNFTELRIVGPNPVTLQGTGTLTLSDNVNNFIVGNSGNEQFTIAQPIQGPGGNVGNGNLTITNQSAINATASAGGNSITIQPGPGGITNNGTLEATGGGSMILTGASGGAFANGNGTTQATGTGSVISLINSPVITGGTLTSSGTSLFQIPGGQSAELINLTNSGTFEIQNNSVAYFSGTVTNTGAMQLNSGGNFTEIRLIGNTTLAGGGTLTMSNNANNFILGNSGNEIFTNANTIQGAGNIGNQNISVVNNGTILANQSNTLFIDTTASGITNNGTLSAAAGSLLDIENGPLNNFNTGTNTLSGGKYVVGGTLEFPSANIVNSSANISLTSSTAQILSSTSSNALANFANNQSGGTFNLSGGANFTTAGNFTNNGTLVVGGTDKFKVTGNLTNFASSTLTGGTYKVAGTLQFGTSGSSLTTNAANITLTGGSAKLVNLGNTNLLTNFATNKSGASFNLTGGATFTTASNFTNSGTMDLEQGSSLTVTGNLTNSGTVTTNGTNLGGSANTLAVTGTLTNNTGGSITIGANNDTTDVANVGTLSNSAPITVGTGATLTLTKTGTQTNKSTITLNGGTLKLSGSSDTLSGTGGVVSLSNSASNLITGVGTNIALTNAETIQGSGTISNLKITDTGTINANQSTPLIILPSSGGLTVSGATGTLTVGTGDTMQIGTSAGGALTNFSGTTLTGGIYNVSGKLQFGASGASIATDAANITLTGAGSQIIDFGNHNLLAGFSNNSAAGIFTLSSGATLTTTGGAFTNAGTFTVSSGSSFKIGGSSFTFTQSGGKSTIDGTLTSSTASTVTLNGGTLFGGGTVNDSLVDNAAVTPADSAAKTAILNVKKTYTQGTAGVLNISIGGTAAGTNFDQLNVTGTASLGGTLNISLINGFVPAVGSTFDILNGSTVSSNWSTINGLSINGSEHFTETVNSNDVILTVVSGAARVAATSLISRSNKGRISFGLVAPHRYSMALARTPAARAVAVHQGAASLPRMTHFRKGFGMMDESGSSLVAPSLVSGYSSTPGYSSLPAASASFPNMAASHGHRRVELVIDLNSALKTSPKRLLKGLFADPDSLDAVSIGYLTSTSVQ